MTHVAFVTSFNSFSTRGDEAAAFSSHGTFLVILSPLPVVLSQSPAKLRALPEILATAQGNPHPSPSPWAAPCSTPDTHLGSYLWLFIALSKLPIEPNTRCLLERTFKKHEFVCTYVEILEVNLTFLSLSHGLKKQTKKL